MKILLTGATGLVGRVLVKKLLEQKHQLHYLSTQKEKLRHAPNLKGFFWDPKNGIMDSAAIEGVEVVIHLAGATISKPWTSAYKNEILSSRTQSTRLLAETLKGRNQKIQAFIGASATGIYPSSYTKFYDETSNEIAADFLGNVVQKWEAASVDFETFANRRVLFRIGLVLAKDGGVLSTLSLPVKWGIGGPVGSGQQWQSWIHIEDLCALFCTAVEKPWHGIYNAVAPEVVTQKTLLKTLAQQLRRPLFFPPVPAFALKCLMGARSSLVLNSQHVSSSRLKASEFKFEYPTLKSAIHALLKK